MGHLGADYGIENVELTHKAPEQRKVIAVSSGLQEEK